MASLVSYQHSGIIDKALFNFDAMNGSNYKLSGTVTVSVSQPFIYTQYLNGYGNQYTWTSDVPAVYWNATQVANLNSILNIYKQFINISFTAVNDYTQYSPLGASYSTNTDINLFLISRKDLSFSGLSALNSNSLGYVGSSLDIILNTANFGSSDYSLDARSYGGHVAMHEIAHSLGLSHPFYPNPATLTTDYKAVTTLGFNKLGFVINSAADMNKEYFSIMSYDNEVPNSSADTFAQTPMIFDVVALQGAYGAGSGSSGVNADVITPGSTAGVDSYRTYFDTGGVDTINLVNYLTGAYLHMGTSIVGAAHLVGISMSTEDRKLMTSAGSPQSLRWFYGEFENAVGSAKNDVVVQNSLNNAIDGGAGIDTAIYSGAASQYQTTTGTQATVVDKTTNRDGTDTLTNVERLKFADTNVALDIGPYQNAGAIYMLYKATFNRAPDNSGMGYWLSQVDSGKNLVTNIAQSFLSTPEFIAKYGTNPSNATYIDKLYQNVLGRSGDAGGVAYWNQQLDSGAVSKAAALVSFATLPEGASNVASLIANGIPYTEWVG